MEYTSKCFMEQNKPLQYEEYVYMTCSIKSIWQYKIFRIYIQLPKNSQNVAMYTLSGTYVQDIQMWCGTLTGWNIACFCSMCVTKKPQKAPS